jgi:hypothetical protein
VHRGINSRNPKPKSPEGYLHHRYREKSLTIGSSRREDCNFGSSVVGRSGMCRCTNSQSLKFQSERVDVVGSDDVDNIAPCGILCEQG